MAMSLLKSRIISLRILLVMSALCTLSWIFVDLTLGTSDADKRDAMMQFYEILSSKNDGYAQGAIMFEQQLAKPQWYCLLCTALDIISMVGMVLMWKLRKNGFHFYALSKLLLIMLPLLFLDRTFIALGDIMIAAFLIVYYFLQLRSINALQEQEASANTLQDQEASAGDEFSNSDDSNSNE